MKTSIHPALLSAALLGGFLLTSGCGTPTTSIGVTSRSNRTILSIRSPVPTQVQCVWRQDGARVQHQNTTPFRLAVPSDSVDAIRLSKLATAAGVAVEIRPPAAKPNRFAFAHGSSTLRLVCDGGGCWTSEQGSQNNLPSSRVVPLPPGESTSSLQDHYESLFATAKRLQ